jgi:hypothetical protein
MPPLVWMLTLAMDDKWVDRLLGPSTKHTPFSKALHPSGGHRPVG